ncbi:tumor necrosis factor receptor superfamily member 27 isoform X8 [Nomascus leucogenys]|uniref:tumor necrosis factor receptor superfamily member 27 isoform X8 n=1 Tax=Nomascus leucogenys TaxID=61853 RepID=UPI00122D8D76|nr:tumor necrosis factor receptor superfamily member 27 isoform X8 [Nomascus leucogenys]
MSTGTNGDGVSPANSVVLDRSYPRCLPVELSGGRCTHSAPSGGHTCCTGGLLQFEADKTAKEESLFPVPPSKETSPESQVSWAPGRLAQLFSLDSVPIPQQQQGPEMWCPQELILYSWGISYPIPPED